PVVTERSLAIAVTQSGETADTVAALAEAASRGARTMAICNSVGSQVTRLAEASLFTRAGVEMGVASTKAFTTQLAVLTLLSLHIGRVRNALPPETAREVISGLRALPAQIERAHDLDHRVADLAARWHRAQSALYLARGPLYPVAL